MQRSDKPTEYIFIKAGTNSEFDTCDFAIVRVNKIWETLIRERLLLLEVVKQVKLFHHLAFWDEVEGFYMHAGASTGQFLRDREPWCFIDITLDELQDLKGVPSELCGLEMAIGFLGMAIYSWYAVQNNDSFYTEGFKIASVLEQLKARII